MVDAGAGGEESATGHYEKLRQVRDRERSNRMARSISAQPPNDTEMLLDQLSKHNDGLSQSLRDATAKTPVDGGGGENAFSNKSNL